MKKRAETAMVGPLEIAVNSAWRLNGCTFQITTFKSSSIILKRRVESLKLGSSNKFDFDLGALTSAAQLERVSGFVIEPSKKEQSY